MHNNQRNQRNNGQAVMLALLVFLGVSVSIIFAVSAPVIEHVKITRDVYDSKQSYYAAEALNEDIIYRLNHIMDVSTNETMTLGGADVEATVSNISGGKEITVTSDYDGLTRKVASSISEAVGVSFNYGVQVGNGGFDISGGSRVIGNVYSNGSILGTGGAEITGSAVAANSSALVADQINGTSGTPSNTITFRNASASQDIAQSFQVSTTSPLNKVRLYLRKQGGPSDATVRIVMSNGSNPGTTNLATANLTASLVTTSFNWVEVAFTGYPELEAGTTYWIVIDNSNQHTGNYYIAGANSSYGNGQAKVGQYNGTWNNTSPSGLDMYFMLYTGGITSTIGGGTYVGALEIGTTATDVAWANNVKGVTVTGPLYCATGTLNNKACNTSRPDPSQTSFPISDGNIEAWQEEASAGTTINGNTTIGWQGTTTGPVVFNGDLTINGGGQMTVTGTVWVKGNLTISNGGSIRLASSYGTDSGVIVVDRRVSLSGGGNLTGSGTAGSYLMLLSNSRCPNDTYCSGNPAMNVTGGAGAVILTAQEGTITFSGGTAARSATAYRLTLTGGTTITYEAGIPNANFSSGPSGTFGINAWQEIE